MLAKLKKSVYKRKYINGSHTRCNDSLYKVGETRRGKHIRRILKDVGTKSYRELKDSTENPGEPEDQRPKQEDDVWRKFANTNIVNTFISLEEITVHFYVTVIFLNLYI